MCGPFLIPAAACFPPMADPPSPAVQVSILGHVLLSFHLSGPLLPPLLKTLVIALGARGSPRIIALLEDQLIGDLNSRASLISLCHVPECTSRFRGQDVDVFEGRGHYSPYHIGYFQSRVLDIVSQSFWHIGTQMSPQVTVPHGAAVMD